MINEPSNQERASRVADLIATYFEKIGESIRPTDIDYCDMAFVVGDIIHLCDKSGEDFENVLRLARQHYEEEQPYTGEEG